MVNNLPAAPLSRAHRASSAAATRAMGVNMRFCSLQPGSNRGVPILRHGRDNE